MRFEIKQDGNIEVYRARRSDARRTGWALVVATGQLQLLVWWGFSMHKTQQTGRGRGLTESWDLGLDLGEEAIIVKRHPGLWVWLSALVPGPETFQSRPSASSTVQYSTVASQVGISNLPQVSGSKRDTPTQRTRNGWLSSN